MDDRPDRYRLLMADVYELAGVSRRTSGRDALAYGATASQWHVLSVLDGGPQTVPAIARRLGITRQGVQRVVNEVTGKGWVRAHPGDANRRSPRIELTAAGRRLLARLWKASTPHRAEVLEEAGITAGDLDAARATLRALADALHRRGV